MKKIISLLLIAPIMLCLPSCSILSKVETFINKTDTIIYGDVSFDIPDYDVRVTMPGNWKEDNDTPYDLYCTNDSAVVGIFAFQAIDLAESQSPEDVYALQKEDIFSKRDNVKVVDDTIEVPGDGKSIKSDLVSAEFEGSKHYYYCCLVEFDDNPDVFLWMLFVAMPSYVEKNLDMFQSIVTSAEFISSTESEGSV